MNKILGDFVRIEQMSGRNGEVKNQFIIFTSKGRVFQSYDSIICARVDGHTFLDERKWNYSSTTGKYRNMFLGETIKETRSKIESGIYTLVDLN